MNERIRQLAELADEYTDNKIQMPGEYHPDWHDVRDEKFAELMVQDCIRTLRSNGYDDAAKCLQDIHFGIENPV